MKHTNLYNIDTWILIPQALYLMFFFLLQVQLWNTAVNVSVIYDKYLKGTEQGLVRYYKSVKI